jgi:hypothetical protein
MCFILGLKKCKKRRETNKTDFKICWGSSHAVATTWQIWGHNSKSTKILSTNFYYLIVFPACIQNSFQY